MSVFDWIIPSNKQQTIAFFISAPASRPLFSRFPLSTAPWSTGLPSHCKPGDDVLTTCDKTHASQRYLQAAEDLRCCSWCFEQILEDRECFLLQRKCAMSASVEIIFFWAWLIILVWENEPKLKETTVNYFESRHHQSIEEYTRDNSESVDQELYLVRGQAFLSSF